jgi:hypothetical protein
MASDGLPSFPKLKCTENATNAGQKRRIVHLITLAAAFGKAWMS